MLATTYSFMLFIFGGMIGGLISWYLSHNWKKKDARLIQNSFNSEKTELLIEVEAANSKVDALTSETNQLKISSNNLQTALSKLTTEYAVLEEYSKRLPTFQEDLEKTKQLLSMEEKRSTELQTRLEEKTKSLAEQAVFIRDAKTALAAEFQIVSQKIFEEKSEKFTQQNKSSLEALLNPFRDQISTFKKKVDDVYDKETKDRVALSQQVYQLKELNQQMSQDAINLTRALRGESKTRGNWGEVILATVLERSGLREGREYETQMSLENEDGVKLQPDVVIHLPEKKDIVVDSKVSLVAYDNYSSADEEDRRSTALQQHLLSIRNHIKDLSNKDYQELKGLNTLGYVLMFVPVEPAFLLAVSEDPELFNFAATRNIFIVSPSNLLVTLKTIHAMWQYAYQNENAVEIAQKAGQMYDKFVGFVESFELVGNRLDQASETWLKAHNQLLTGKGNLIKRAEDLKQMGVRSKKELPIDTSPDES
ncbi:MAG: DNA recombination protein RmuC [Acidiferrobacteraceae bacterium]|nr:DNA recombination protein RmuC [Acidiferrobacteraceae bacterium]